jgi:hypothetical protein
MNSSHNNIKNRNFGQARGKFLLKKMPKSKRISLWNFVLYPVHWLIKFWTFIYVNLIHIISKCLGSGVGSSSNGRFNRHKLGNGQNWDRLVESDFFDNDKIMDRFDRSSSDDLNDNPMKVCHQSILTEYQTHMIELEEAVNFQEQLLQNLNNDDDDDDDDNDDDDDENNQNNQNENHNSPNLKHNYQNKFHTNPYAALLSKKAQLNMQLSINLDIQRRISTDLYQLTFERQHYTKQTRTCLGKIQNIFSYFLAVFGVGKILLTLKNIIITRSTTITGGQKQEVDLPTLVVQFVLRRILHINSSVDLRWYSTWLSLIFLGGLTATQMRGFLINFTKIFRTFSLFISPPAILFVFTMVMGIYFVSMVLLSRVHLPFVYRKAITHVLGHLQFQFYHDWFDIIFLIAAVSTFGLFYLFRKMRPTNDTIASGY